jgi:hypothetical protein
MYSMWLRVSIKKCRHESNHGDTLFTQIYSKKLKNTEGPL